MAIAILNFINRHQERLKGIQDLLSYAQGIQRIETSDVRELSKWH